MHAFFRLPTPAIILWWSRAARVATITDMDGNRFLDFCAGIAVASTGHCQPQVVAAIQRRAAQSIHMSGTDFYYENMVEVAEQLCGPDRKVLFGNFGTEAMEAALKLARYTTGSDKFIAFYGAFHGRTMGALSPTARRPMQRSADDSFWGGGYGGAALHFNATPVVAPQNRWTFYGTACGCLRQHRHWQPAGREYADGSAGERGGGYQYDEFA